MMTSSNGNIFSFTGTRSFGVFFDLRLNKRLSKQSRGWWFETLPRPLWRHSNDESDILTKSCECFMKYIVIQVVFPITEISQSKHMHVWWHNQISVQENRCVSNTEHISISWRYVEAKSFCIDTVTRKQSTSNLPFFFHFVAKWMTKTDVIISG